MATSQGALPALLDELQAAEEAGAEALGLWIAGCDDPRLRGGLRVIRARDLQLDRSAGVRLETGARAPEAVLLAAHEPADVRAVQQQDRDRRKARERDHRPRVAEQPRPDHERHRDAGPNRPWSTPKVCRTVRPIRTRTWRRPNGVACWS